MADNDARWDDLTDGDLVRTARTTLSPATERAAIAAIFDRHHERVLAFCGAKLQDPHLAADAASETFLEAWADLPDLREPDKLGRWLIGIAANQCRQIWRDHSRREPPPEDNNPEAEADAYSRASKARRAEVDSLLDAVVETFTEKQRLLFQLTVRQGVHGVHLAAALGSSAEQASRNTYDIITLANAGFGALILARQGRRYCRDLDRILTDAAKAGSWDGQYFTAQLRQRLVRHLNDCSRCDNCQTCNEHLPLLIKPFAPVVTPILIAGAVRERVLTDRRDVIGLDDLLPGPRHGGPTPPDTSGSTNRPTSRPSGRNGPDPGRPPTGGRPGTNAAPASSPPRTGGSQPADAGRSRPAGRVPPRPPRGGPVRPDDPSEAAQWIPEAGNTQGSDNPGSIHTPTARPAATASGPSARVTKEKSPSARLPGAARKTASPAVRGPAATGGGRPPSAAPNPPAIAKPSTAGTPHLPTSGSSGPSGANLRTGAGGFAGTEHLAGSISEGFIHAIANFFVHVIFAFVENAIKAIASIIAAIIEEYAIPFFLLLLFGGAFGIWKLLAWLF